MEVALSNCVCYSRAMKVCIDVGYAGEIASVAAVSFLEWQDAVPLQEQVFAMKVPSEYIPGAFFKREMPCIVEAIHRMQFKLDLVVIDGYVWLADGVAGLGAILFTELGESMPVVGVAKNPYRGQMACRVLRGDSRRPLYVSAVGIRQEDAAEHVREMHGKHRVPTMIKRADQLSRGIVE